MPPTDAQTDPIHPWWRAAPAFWRQAVMLATLLIAIFAVYFSCYRFGFVYDDSTRIYSNPWLSEPGGWRLMLTSHSFAFDPNEAPKYYRPVVMLWFLLNHHLFGLNAAGWHLTTLLIHLLATVMVFLTTRKLTTDFRGALFTAALWALHPTRVESVAWISGVDDALVLVLVLVAFLLSLHSGSHASKSSLARAGSLAAFTLALLTKETAVIFPFILFAFWWLCDDGTVKPRLRMAVRQSYLYCALLIPYFAMRSVVLKTFIASQPPQPWLATLWTAPLLLAKYLKLWFWPTGLSAFYSVDPAARLDTPVILAIATLAFGAIVIWWWHRKTREPLILFASAWFLLFVAPALSIRLLNEGDLLHDRYLYESSIGLALMLALAIRDVATQVPKLSKVLAVGSVMLVTTLAVLAARQSFFWSSNVSLYRRAIAVAPRNEVPYINLGIEYANRGMWTEAADTYRQLDAIHPGSHRVLVSLAAMELNAGDLASAETDTKRAIRVNGTLASDWLQLGVLERRLGDLQDSEQSLRAALAREGGAQGIRRELAITLLQAGKPEAAEGLLRQELEMNPSDSEAIDLLSHLRAEEKPKN